MSDSQPKRFQITVANVLFAMVPLAVMFMGLAYARGSAAAAFATLVLGGLFCGPAAIGALLRGFKGFVIGFFVSMFILVMLSIAMSVFRG
jgi:hypothetical protein